MIGILLNGLSIFFGGMIGAFFEKYVKNIRSLTQMLGISIMFLSIINIISGMLVVEGNSIQTQNILLIVFCIIAGAIIGEKTGLDKKLKCDETAKGAKNAFVTATMVFGIGGLQIIGSISAVVSGDSSILISKCFVDLPLALSLGAMMGTGVAFSGIPVGIMQLLIGGIAFMLRGFFSDEVITQLCSMGYVILFFVGFNMVFDGVVKVKTDNLIPSILLIIIYNLLKNVCFGG